MLSTETTPHKSILDLSCHKGPQHRMFPNRTLHNVVGAGKMIVGRLAPFHKTPDGKRLMREWVPPYTGTPFEIAEQVLEGNKNAFGGFQAGLRNFRNNVWNVDTGIAWNGLLQLGTDALVGKKSDDPKKITLDDLVDEVQTFVSLSLKSPKEHVFTGFIGNKKGRVEGMDIPYERVDNLPVLIYKIDRLQKTLRQQGRDVFQEIPLLRESLGIFISRYIQDFTYGPEKKYLVDMGNKGDWVDSVPRVSSSWANIWQLQMLQTLEKWEQDPRIGKIVEKPEDFNFATFKATILEECMPKPKPENGEFYFIDGQHADVFGTDANALALYLDIFTHDEKMKIIHAFQQRPHIFYPFPLLAVEVPHRYHPGLRQNFFPSLATPDYHNVVWPHLGTMYTIGLLKAAQEERDVATRELLLSEARKQKSQVDAIVGHFGNFVETLERRKKRLRRGNNEPLLYETGLYRSETNFTMGAGPYIEMIALSQQMEANGIPVGFSTS